MNEMEQTTLESLMATLACAQDEAETLMLNGADDDPAQHLRVTMYLMIGYARFIASEIDRAEHVTPLRLAMAEMKAHG